MHALHFQCCIQSDPSKDSNKTQNQIHVLFLLPQMLFLKCYFLSNTLCPKDDPSKQETIKTKIDFTYEKNNILYVLKYHCTDAVF